ncbi:unnamed protein product, partial [Ectocarpus fasciculatus]
LRVQEVQLGVLMMLFYASMGAMLPYLPVYYRHLGLSEHEIGSLGAISPVVTLVFGPLWAAIADRYQIQKSLLVVTFLVSALSRTGLIVLRYSNVGAIAGMVALSASLAAPARPLLDAAVMNVLKKKSSYGRARLFGQIGFGLGSYIAGLFVSKHIHLIAAVHALFAVPTVLVMLRLLPPDKDRATNNASLLFQRTTDGGIRNETHSSTVVDVDYILALGKNGSRPQTYLFFSVVLAAGILSGIIENFSINRVVETSSGSSIQKHLGILPLTASLAGAPVFWMSGKLIAYFGVPNILGLSLLSYLLRFIIYAQMTNPWFAIPAEVLKGATFASFWAATTHFVYNIAPRGHAATVLGILNGVYTGIGQSIGSLIGGRICKMYGISGAFRRAGAINAVLLG